MIFPILKVIDIDITNKCGLACPGCQRQKIYNGDQSKIPGRDITLKEFEMISNFFEEVVFCGRISDPIYHPQFLDILKICSKKSDKRFVIRHASVINDFLFYKKCFLLSKIKNNISWTFGLDGLPEKSHIYRKKQNGKLLFEVMKLCAKMGVKTQWDYIIFNYNINDIETCREMAKNNGIKFNPIMSTRSWEEEHLYKPQNSNINLESYCYIRDVINLNEKGK